MKRKTIRNHLDFLAVTNELSTRRRFFMLKARISNKDGLYGLVVPKRTFKTAVQRNRVKRLLRNWIADKEKFMEPDMDYVFIAYPKILEADRTMGCRDTMRALKKISRLRRKLAKEQKN